MTKITIKTPEEMAVMAEGGKILAYVRDELFKIVAPGVTAWDVEMAADRLIKEKGAFPSFKKVQGYSWATCINVNTGVVHGIPRKETVFEDGDVVSVDVGVFYKGFHTDTAVTKYLGKDPKIVKFLETGRRALNNAIKQAKAGNTIGDIAKAYQDTLNRASLNPVRSLTGHGVGKNLHEDPYIPCFTSNSASERVKIVPGMTLALEVMYTFGSGDLTLDNDGWTLRTKDAKLAALFEETVAIGVTGTSILTR